ncbi:PspA/IM30 family protein [Paenibacillus lemnae]|uniref:PspA/IM30 family protein n=1 Tax=Paenibacillus lemnae TaxID=1330551 RepID=A0A848MDU9_PAELE|nr:PspA/IM30 family protein [Paenibacillus lemnae]NMO97594.1 PspA/IM30 family protein [Paenibacillus lemnae]
MGILSRFRDLMASNFHAVMDKAEDPEKAVREYMQRLSSDLGQIKAVAAAVLAQERRAKRALDDCRAEIMKLQNYAEKSVQGGNEQNALRFLDRKAEQEQKLAQLQEAYNKASANAENMRKLQEKLVADVRDLEARHARVKSRMAAAKLQQKSAAGSTGAASSAFDAMEEKADLALYEAEAMAELRAGSQEPDLDELFEELKKQTHNSTEQLR